MMEWQTTTYGVAVPNESEWPRVRSVLFGGSWVAVWQKSFSIANGAVVFVESTKDEGGGMEILVPVGQVKAYALAREA